MVANNEKKEKYIQKQTICKISRSDITHSGEYGQNKAVFFVQLQVHLVF